MSDNLIMGPGALELALLHHVTPRACYTCQRADFGSAGTDYNPYESVVWQCLGCGRYTQASLEEVTAAISFYSATPAKLKVSA